VIEAVAPDHPPSAVRQRALNHLARDAGVRSPRVPTPWEVQKAIGDCFDGTPLSADQLSLIRRVVGDGSPRDLLTYLECEEYTEIFLDTVVRHDQSIADAAVAAGMDLRLDPDLIHRWVMIRRSSTVSRQACEVIAAPSQKGL
jgi:hypothetical protein